VSDISFASVILFSSYSHKLYNKYILIIKSIVLNVTQNFDQT